MVQALNSELKTLRYRARIFLEGVLLQAWSVQVVAEMLKMVRINAVELDSLHKTDTSYFVLYAWIESSDKLEATTQDRPGHPRAPAQHRRWIIPGSRWPSSIRWAPTRPSLRARASMTAWCLSMSTSWRSSRQRAGRQDERGAASASGRSPGHTPTLMVPARLQQRLDVLRCSPAWPAAEQCTTATR